MAGEFMTKLDILGMRLATEELAEKISGISGEKTSSAKISALESMDELLKRDKDREKDGFFSKIRFRRVVVGPNRVIVVPYVEEERLVHGEFEPKKIIELSRLDEENGDIGESTGHGKGEVGDIIGRKPLFGDEAGEGEDGDGDGDESGEGASHGKDEQGFEEDAYEAGQKLMENLKLPNIREKRKKFPSDEYTYDLTDRYRGSGQVLDKRETLKRIIKTNLVLGRVEKDNLDPSKMIVSPQDKVFRVLSRERVWKSKAVVFFLGDHSPSMWGEPLNSLRNQQGMIYSWLLAQYEKMVICRCVIHGSEAKEVIVYRYFRSTYHTGGTFIASGYKKINEIVEGEGLEKDYNIYVFQGTDGDDFDKGGRTALPELQKILDYANRVGVTLFKHPYFAQNNRKTTFEEYVEDAGILERKNAFRMHIMPNTGITEEMNTDALKALVAQD